MIGKILVTGANGSVGGEIINALIDVDQPVKAAVRDLNKAYNQIWNKKYVEIVEFDYRDKMTWKKTFNGVDRMVVVAPPGDPNAFDVVSPSLEHAIENGIRKIVLISAMGVEASDDIPLRKLELLIEGAGVPHTILRCNWFMQNFGKMFRPDILNRSEIRAPAGDGKVAFIDCRDIAEIVQQSLISDENDNNTYEITGGEALSYQQVAEKFSMILGKEIQYIPLSEEEAQNEFISMGIPVENVATFQSLFAAIRNGWSAKINNDLSDILERNPTPLDQYIQDFAHIWQNSQLELEM